MSTTGLSFWARNKLNYNVIMKYEHVNTAHEIKSIINYIFENVEETRFPLPFHHFSFYTYFQAKKPNIEKALYLLNRYENIT